MSTEAAEAVQDKLEALQKELHDALAKSDDVFDQKRIPILAARDAAIAEMIAKDELPKDFWASAIIALFTLRSRESEAFPHFLGPYDERLLRAYLRDVRVVLGEKGGQRRLALSFAENPFFAETELWAELRAPEALDEEDEEDDVGAEEALVCSGITWKEGHGPEGLDSEEDENDGEGDEKTRKREREGDDASAGDGKETVRGPSVLEVFSTMAPHPEEDPEFDDADDDEVADAVAEYEDEMEDRRTVVTLLTEDLFTRPQAAINGWQAIESVVEEVNKKLKME